MEIEKDNIHDLLTIDITLNEFQSSFIWRVLFIYTPVIIFSIGTLGNLCCFLIFAKLSRRRNKNSINSIGRREGLTVYLYLSALAAFDLGVLYTGMFNEWVYHMTDYNLKDTNIFLCKGVTFVSFFFSHCSSFLVVLITGLRCLAIYSPLKASQLATKKYVMITCATLVLVAGLLNIHYLWSMQLNRDAKNEEKFTFSDVLELLQDDGVEAKESDLRFLMNRTDMPKCFIDENRFKTVWMFIDQIFYCLLPFILIIVFNSQIIKNISKYEQAYTIVYNSKRPEVNIHEQRKPLQIKMEIENFKKYHLVSQKFTVMLISMSVCFLIFIFPSVLLFVMLDPITSYIENLDTSISQTVFYYECLIIVQQISLVLMYMNHSSNFFICFASSIRFRRTFVSVFYIKKKKSISNRYFCCSILLKKNVTTMGQYD